MKSAIYRGWIRHRRREPVRHDFRSQAFLMYLDLEELPRLFDPFRLWSARGPAPAWFRRNDHFGDPSVPLHAQVSNLVRERTGTKPDGPIRLLTHLRYFGHCFNPVSFYYCFDSSGERVETIVAEITNTPWQERHCYVLPMRDNLRDERRPRFRFSKDFHVSPFMEMDVDYDWHFTVPGERLVVHMENLRDQHTFFEATMVLERRAITQRELTRCLVRYPLMTVQVVAAIHWQALRLWWKRAPVFPHPREQEAREVSP